MNARAILSFSRDLEFASETELAKRMGCERGLWLRATVQELIDNSLDAAEETGVATPEISVRTDGDTPTVTDNGPGMPPEMVERLCIRSERTSTREAYAAPDRGAQGNALQLIMALPFGFCLEDARLTITSQGVEHTIVMRVNRLEGRIRLERSACEAEDRRGTIITLDWPEKIVLDVIETLIDHHAWLNPHAEFQLNDDVLWQATAEVAKWPLAAPIPPQWYTPERFAHRVLLEIRRDREITVAQFLGFFKGLTSSTKHSEVAVAADLSYQPLAALLDTSGTTLDLDRTRVLLTAMQRASRAPKPHVLGAVGKETFELWAASKPDYGGP
jgi:DNA topoisomerase VI subunit B